MLIFNFQVGSGGNDSLGSGHHSPNGSEMVRSESALELRGGRKTSLPALSASQMQKSVFRKSMPMHLEVIFFGIWYFWNFSPFWLFVDTFWPFLATFGVATGSSETGLKFDRRTVNKTALW